MSDYIRREDAVEQVKELFEMGDCYCDCHSIGGMLNMLPSADVVERSDEMWANVFIAELAKDMASDGFVKAVLCKNCEYSCIETDADDRTNYRWCSWIGREVDDNTFCYWGKEKR